MAYEPGTALRQISSPVLAITGSKDIQVDPGDLVTMGRLVTAEFTSHLVEDVTHLLRSESGPPSVRTYKKQAKRPVEPKVLELVARWVIDRTTVSNGSRT